MTTTYLKDDPSIRNECALLRRIPANSEMHIIWDNNLKRWCPSSASFDDHTDGSPMSVVLGDELDAAGRDAATVLDGHDRFALAAISAGIARRNRQAVARDPLPQEPAHGLVIGRKSKAVRSSMAKAAQWVVAPSIDT